MSTDSRLHRVGGLTPKQQVLKQFPKAFAVFMFETNLWYITSDVLGENLCEHGCPTARYSWALAAAKISGRYVP